MELVLVGALAALALVDSTSFGTLGVPVWMLAQRRVRVRPVLVYLGVIALFYWLLGLALLTGADAALRIAAHVGDAPAVRWVELMVGVALLLGSFLPGGTLTSRFRADRERAPGRRAAWKARVVGDDVSSGAVALVAVVAGLVEAASMVPYLAAIGLLTTTGAGLPMQAAALAAYVVVMTVPALLLLAGRLLAARRLAPVLERIDGWMQRNSGELLAWAVGIVGFLLAIDAYSALFG